MHILYDVSFILSWLQFEYNLHTYCITVIVNTVQWWHILKYCNKSSCWFHLNLPYLGLFPGKESLAHPLPPNYKPCLQKKDPIKKNLSTHRAILPTSPYPLLPHNTVRWFDCFLLWILCCMNMWYRNMKRLFLSNRIWWIYLWSFEEQDIVL